MDITEVLEVIDELVSSQTKQHLDNIQRGIIQGVWEGKTYEEIANECNYSEGHVRDIAYKLWKVLSDVLGEKVNKSNFRVTLERFINSQNSNTLIYKDLTQAPRIIRIYGREKELSTLSQWIENPKTHLISVLGLAGIGKSTMVRYFIDINPQPFDVIIWKNLKLHQSLKSIITDILTEVEINDNNLNNKNILQSFLNLLTKKRCLIIFENLHELFTLQQFVGQYKSEYNDYKDFLKMITEIEHQSCLILISREKCQEMISLDNELYPSYCLELSGLDESAKNILLNQGLKNQETWTQLINLYEGHPRYLQTISILIKNVFDGEVSEFIKENCLLLTDEIKFIFDSTWLRLSEVEKVILLEFSKENSPLSIGEIKQALSLSSPDIIQGLNSLKQRFLLTLFKENQKLFNLSPIFREYLKCYH